MKIGDLIGATAVGVTIGVVLGLGVFLGPLISAIAGVDPHELTDPCEKRGGVQQIETNLSMFSYGAVVLCRDGTVQEPK